MVKEHKKLTISEARKMFDVDYEASYEQRQRAISDAIFYHVTQWDDDLASVTLGYRGQFDVLKKAGRGILSDLAENQVQVDFDPMDKDRKDAADVADGLYRSLDGENTSIEAYEVGKQEAVVSGCGHWELYTDYSSRRSESKKQVVRRKPIYESHSTVIWDSNAKLLDKSDARHVWKLCGYSESAYKEYVSDLTGEDVDDVKPSDFQQPDTKNGFSWYCAQSNTYYIAALYVRRKQKSKIVTIADPFGQETTMRDHELKSVMDDLIDEGFNVVSEKEIEEYRVTKYILSGKEILYDGLIAGQYLPIIPMYGERTFVNGKEIFSGITGPAKDPQMLRNFSMSYLADLLSKSPRPKPLFFPEQITGNERFFEDGPDNMYPYGLVNRLAPDGSQLPAGPMGQMPETPVPQALGMLIQLTKEAVEDVANPGVAQDVADVDISGKAVNALQATLEKQSAIYQSHFKHAKRWDATVWASMASEIMDTPRIEVLTLQDGTRKEVEVMQTVQDKETGDVKVLNDIYDVEFEVQSKIGPSYSSQKDQTVEKLSEMWAALQPGDPMKEILMLKIIRLQDGVDTDDIREYANKKLVLLEIKKPETDEEKQWLAEAKQQPAQPDANMVLAQAEMAKAQAMQMHEQQLAQNNMIDAQLRQKQLDIDVFNAQTKRMEAEIKAQEADAKITRTDVESYGKHIDNQIKATGAMQPEMVE